MLYLLYYVLYNLLNTSAMTRSRSFLVLARRDVSFSCAALLLSTSFVRDAFWLRTNGVNTNGAAAKAMTFVRLGKEVRAGNFGKIQGG